jgi:hypothetical protein
MMIEHPNRSNLEDIEMANGVIVYLSCTKDVPLLTHSLRLLFQNYNSKYNYPVIVFHDDISLVLQANIRMALFAALGTMPSVKFVHVEFTIPPHVSSDPALYDPPLTRHRLGYRHMCRFFSGEVYKHPELSKYRWYMRLDSDSFIHSGVNYDIFERMEEKKFKYGYMSQYDVDSLETSRGFCETAFEYFSRSPEATERLNNKLVDGKWDLSVFYSNFVLADLDFMRGTEYQSFYEYIDATGNIYYRRWGDHDVQWFGINAMVPESEIWCVKDIAYQHGAWVQNVQYIKKESAESIPSPYREWALNASV